MKKILSIFFLLISIATAFGQAKTRLQVYQKIDGLVLNVPYTKSLLDTLTESTMFLNGINALSDHTILSGGNGLYDYSIGSLGRAIRAGRIYATSTIDITTVAGGTINTSTTGVQFNFSTNGVNADGTGLKFLVPGTFSTGGMLYKNSSGYMVAVNPGSNGNVMTLAGGLPTWAAPSGSVTSVSGITNRITSTGGTTPVIDISATFEALLGKVASPLSQFAATTSAQFAGVISDELGTGNVVLSSSLSSYQPIDAGLTTLSGLDVVGNAGKKIEVDGSGNYVATSQFTNPCSTADCLAKFNGTTYVALNAGTAYQPLRMSSGTVLGYGSLDISQSAVVGSSILGSTNGGAGSISGILKANGSGTVSAAVSGTDYQLPGLSRLLTGTNTFTGAIIDVGSATNTYSLNYGNLGTTVSYFSLDAGAAAAAGAQQRPVSFRMRGQGWHTASSPDSEFIDFTFTGIPVQGVTHPSGSFSFASGVDGGAANAIWTATITESNTLSTFAINGPVSTTTLSTGNVTTVGSNSTTGRVSVGLLAQPVVSKTANYTVSTSSEGTILCDGTSAGFTISLPAAGTATSNVYAIKKTDADVSHAIVIDPNASELIDGATTYSLTAQNQTAYIQSNGTSWYLIAKSGIGGSTGTTDRALLVANGAGTATVQTVPVTFDASGNSIQTSGNTKVHNKILPLSSSAVTATNVDVLVSSDIIDGDALTISIDWTAKSSSDNTGVGGTYVSTWTKESGTLNFVGEVVTLSNNDSGDVITVTTIDTSGKIQFSFARTGTKSYRIAAVAKIVQYAN